MPKKKKTEDSSEKHIDVKRPNKTTPSATSRPVIIGHAPLMRDPMVKDEDNSVPGAPQVNTSDKRMNKLMGTARTRITIQPSGTMKDGKSTSTPVKPQNTTAPDTPANQEEGKSIEELAAKVQAKKPPTKKVAVTSNDDSEESAAVKEIDEQDAKPESSKDEANTQASSKQSELDTKQPKENNDQNEALTVPAAQSSGDGESSAPQAGDDQKEPEESVDEGQSEENEAENQSEAGVLNAVAEQAVKNKPKTEQVDKEREAYNKKVQKLIDEKTYVVPIGHLRRRRTLKVVIFLLLILTLITSGLYAAHSLGYLSELNIPMPF